MTAPLVVRVAQQEPDHCRPLHADRVAAARTGGAGHITIPIPVAAVSAPGRATTDPL